MDKNVTRLRYKKLNDLNGTYYRTDNLICFSDKIKTVYASFNPETLEYEINEVSSTYNGPLSTGKGTSMHNVKKLIKSDLRKLGITFMDEVRRKK